MAWKLLPAELMRAFILVIFSLLIGCSRAEANGGAEAKALAPREGGRKAEVTPALAKKAEELLREHADAAIGSEYPFTLDGRRYVGRIEEHDNPTGEADRPAGKHKGVTVYERP
jgi:hypothetical protein